MKGSHVGLLAGLLLGIAAATGGVGYFFLALLFGLIGLVVGRFLENEVDLNELLSSRGRDR